MKIEVGIEPLPQSRIRFSGGRAYEESRIKSYKEEVALVAKIAMAGAAPIATPLSVAIKLFRKIKIASRRFGDCDNHCKAVLDALNGVVFADDAQVTKLSAEKFYSDCPHLEIEIQPV